MLFNSLTFLLFFIVVFALHRLAGSWTLKKSILLVGSYIFYAAWNPPYLLILIFSTTMDWWLARRIGQCADIKKRKALLVVSIVANLALLSFFKYGSFLLDNFQLLLAHVGIIYAPPSWSIVLPIGVSFYTFASLSYTIDVYKREIVADASYLDYALFVAFFPHLVCGPIVRARTLLPQLSVPRSASREQVGWGLALVIMGLFCKTVLADGIFAPVVDKVFAQPGSFAAADVWLGVFGFSGQIYYDFGGYSLCAIGLALCFGFSFPDNFHYPYAARSFSDFWRRWHISLSTWLRDYLYIPLGGSRFGPWKTYRNLMITMLLGGLWHGASWMFVLWGALHGAFLSVERMFGLFKTTYPGVIKRTVASLSIFVLISLAWIPFRARDMQSVYALVARMGSVGGTNSLELITRFVCVTALLVTLRWHYLLRDTSLEEYLGKTSVFVRTSLMAVCMIGIFLMSGGDERAFIYFQF